MRISFVILLAFLSLQSMAQDPMPTISGTAKTTKEAGDIARTDKDVPVPQPKSDRAIAERLTKIFKLTEWFDKLEVKSQEGVVTLSGVVAGLEQRQWAIDLATDADGVVAVINKVELKQSGWFDLSSTKSEVKNLWIGFFRFIPRLVVGIFILFLASLLFRTFSKLNKRFWEGRIENSILSDLVSKLGAIPVLLIGIYLVLQVWGLTGLAFTILGGTGALGLVAGFAFKNILENYFSSVMLSIRKPFVPGDKIEVAGEKGIVFKMTTRGTTLVDADGKHILIPNSTIFTSIIRNQTTAGETRVKIVVPVLQQELEKQKEQIAKIISQRSEIIQSPASQINLISTEKGPVFEVSFWVDPKKTSTDKIQQLLSSEFSSSAPVRGETKAKNEEETENEVQAVLARAAAAAALTPNPKEQHL